MKWDDAMLNQLDQAYEPTPDDFHQAVRRRLISPGEQRKKAFPVRAALIAALCAALLAGTALALDKLGVLYFLTRRIAGGHDAAIVEQNVALPVRQTCDSDFLTADVRDLWMDGNRLAVCFHLEPKEPERYRLLAETDIGTDGERFDRIWWNGQILSFDQWLPEGKQMLIISPQAMEVGGVRLPTSQDWMPQQQGETFYVEGDLSRLISRRGTFNPDGTVTVTVAIDVSVYGTETHETALLMVTLKAPDDFAKEEKP